MLLSDIINSKKLSIAPAINTDYTVLVSNNNLSILSQKLESIIEKK
jgi:hypothetical protein